MYNSQVNKVLLNETRRFLINNGIINESVMNDLVCFGLVCHPRVKDVEIAIDTAKKEIKYKLFFSRWSYCFVNMGKIEERLRNIIYSELSDWKVKASKEKIRRKN